MTGHLIEGTGARDGLSDRMHAVAAAFEVTPPSAASLRRHAERRRTTRRVLGGGAAALIAAVLLLAPDGDVTTAPTPVPPATRPSVTAATPTPVVTPTGVAAPVPTGWGPDVPHFAVLGRPMAGAQPWPGDATVRTMTEVSTGVVYLDPTRGQVVHRGWDEQETVIGATPWPRADQRELVGNPGHDLVSWVESLDGARGDLVVVRASTGVEVARTPVPGDPVRTVFIASVDAEAVYFATPWAHSRPGAPVPGENVWTWRWSTGAPPEDARDIAERIFDVSSGVWAVQGPRGIQITDSAGQVTLTTDHPGDKQVFGQVLSPDGRFWRTSSEAVTEIATGDVIEVPGTRGMSESAWSGVNEQVLFVDGRLKVCTYPSGACSRLLDFPDADGTLPYMPTS